MTIVWFAGCEKKTTDVWNHEFVTESGREMTAVLQLSVASFQPEVTGTEPSSSLVYFWGLFVSAGTSLSQFCSSHSVTHQFCMVAFLWASSPSQQKEVVEEELARTENSYQRDLLMVAWSMTAGLKRKHRHYEFKLGVCLTEVELNRDGPLTVLGALDWWGNICHMLLSGGFPLQQMTRWQQLRHRWSIKWSRAELLNGFFRYGNLNPDRDADVTTSSAAAASSKRNLPLKIRCLFWQKQTVFLEFPTKLCLHLNCLTMQFSNIRKQPI